MDSQVIAMVHHSEGCFARGFVRLATLQLILRFFCGPVYSLNVAWRKKVNLDAFPTPMKSVAGPSSTQPFHPPRSGWNG